MRFIYKAVGTAIAGYAVKKVIDNLERRGKLAKPVKDVRMAFNKATYKLGLISEKQKAEWNKNTIEDYNASRKLPVAVSENHPEQLSKHHENSSANKAVMSSTDKSSLRGVPVKAM